MVDVAKASKAISDSDTPGDATEANIEIIEERLGMERPGVNALEEGCHMKPPTQKSP